MEQLSLVAGLQIMLAFYLLIGVYLRKRKIIPRETTSYFTDFTLMVCFPFTVFNSLNSEFSSDKAFSVLILLIIGFACMFASSFAGKILYRGFPARRRAVMQYGTIISNGGFIGLPIAGHIYGAEGLFYASFFIIPTRVFVWTAGISLFTNADLKTKVKNVALNPSIIAVYLGVARMLLHFQVPAPLQTAFTAIGNCTTPLSMIVVGMILADVPLKNVIDRDVLIVSFARLIALPGALLIVMNCFGMDKLMTGVAVTIIGMPVGATAAVLAQKYGADAEFGSRCILVSTTLSLITIPIFTMLM